MERKCVFFFCNFQNLRFKSSLGWINEISPAGKPICFHLRSSRWCRCWVDIPSRGCVLNSSEPPFPTAIVARHYKYKVSNLDLTGGRSAPITVVEFTLWMTARLCSYSNSVRSVLMYLLFCLGILSMPEVTQLVRELRFKLGLIKFQSPCYFHCLKGKAMSDKGEFLSQGVG